MNSEQRTLEYNPALDGLRTLAVLLVFIFHAAPGILPSGFIGVDIFFVLSGYLITSILLIQFREDRPRTLRTFYLRRIRRLLPATITMLAGVAIWESTRGSQLQFSTLRREILATLFNIANWNQILQSDDYFSEDFKSPLRHMWSLAVEEQFYLFWPLLLIGLLKANYSYKRIALVAFGILITSFIIFLSFYSPVSISRSYYGTDSRMFQLIAGCLLSLYRDTLTPHLRQNIRRAKSAGFWSLGILLTFAFLGREDLPIYFQGGAFLIAIASASLITSLEHDSVITRIFSSRLLSKFGLVSYSFYLWHYPIITWMQPDAGSSFIDRRVNNIVQFVFTAAIAIGSYFIIERQFRATSRLSQKVSWLLLSGAFFSVGAFSLVAFSNQNPIVQEALNDRSYQSCPDQPAPCIKVRGSIGGLTIATVGDSTAQALDPALQIVAHKYGITYVQAAKGGCPIGVRLLATGVNGELHKVSNLECFEQTEDIYDQLINDFDPDVILATSWNEMSPHLTNGVLVPRNLTQHAIEVEAALRASIATLTSNGALVIFVDILPTGPSVECLYENEVNEGDCVVDISETVLEDRYNEIFSKLAQEHDGVIGSISLEKSVCPDNSCPIIVDGLVTRYDGRHFTGSKSRALASYIADELIRLGVPISPAAVR